MSRSVSQPAGNGLAGGNIVPTTDSPWVERLLMLHRRVRDAVVESGRAGAGTRNAKGDDVKLFDLAANDGLWQVRRCVSVPAFRREAFESLEQYQEGFV